MNPPTEKETLKINVSDTVYCGTYKFAELLESINSGVLHYHILGFVSPDVLWAPAHSRAPSLFSLSDLFEAA